MRIDLVEPRPENITDAVSKMLNGSNKSELARELDVSRETIYRWERGDAIPTLPELQRLAALTGHEVRLRFNSQEPDIDEQIADLQRSFSAFAAGRMALLDVIEDALAKNHEVDPVLHERLERIRESIRRLV